MLGYKPKTDEVLNHWIAFAYNFAIPPLEFYTAVEQELTNSNIPGLGISQFDYREGGLLSNKRIYLRMIRERLAFDICAAPFGNHYFFSCRTIFTPAFVGLWQVLAVIIFFGMVYYSLYQLLGMMLSAIAFSSLLLALFWTMRNAIAMGLSDLDTLLLKIPALGPIYERWFRKKDTYYREDTRLMYLQTVSDVVKKLAEDVTAAKGVKLVRQYELAPILGELYKPVLPHLDTVHSP